MHEVTSHAVSEQQIVQAQEDIYHRTYYRYPELRYGYMSLKGFGR
ncbi:hypothetical protein [Streptomyces roseoverticillatus]|nr:hypothetical protein [Streptomyces roseoverticillatus]